MIAPRTPTRALAASSQRSTPAEAVLEISARLRAQGFRPAAEACALVFASSSLARDADALAAALTDVLGAIPFIGFVGGSAFHDVRMRERQPALVVLVLPGVRGAVRSAPLGTPGPVDLAHDDGDERAAQLLADAPRGAARFVALAVDPVSPGRIDLLAPLDEQGVPLAGGLAVAAHGDRPVVLTRNGGAQNTLAMLDVAGLDVVLGVAQAARPLGPTRTVTAVSHNVILELDGRRAFDALVDDLPAPMRKDPSALGTALCAGVAMEDGASSLVRSVVAVDRDSGGVAIAAQPRVGTEVVFSLRDGRAAREDLDDLLRALKEALGRRRPRAFVVFSCVARDEGLFGAPCFDAQALLARFGTDIPVVGCATGGELATYGTGSYLFSTSAVVAALI